jgi:hypothetical protein
MLTVSEEKLKKVKMEREKEGGKMKTTIISYHCSFCFITPVSKSLKSSSPLLQSSLLSFSSVSPEPVLGTFYKETTPSCFNV